MDNEKRTGSAESQEDLRELLNPQQRMTLGELEMLGWSLKFVRRPLFQEPVPVVVSDDDSEIGLLDPDGKIIIDKNSSLRNDDNRPVVASATTDEAAVETETTAEAVVSSSWVEKRKGESPVPEDLEEYLNPQQLRALHQIQNFGWELKFVRRPLFQEPIAVIMNNDGDRIGTLEADGRIDLKDNFDLREGTVEPPAPENSTPDKKKKVVPR